jgi:hypothetical protein
MTCSGKSASQEADFFLFRRRACLRPAFGSFQTIVVRVKVQIAKNYSVPQKQVAVYAIKFEK